ncbi:AGE family epimerase/isomerase [Lutimonas vermicola]|uniref:AGE family epimerase/isomerase n=1 Tax=Lutimonas vermicola TaxID=414288 RepID=A0ABU9L798_9FLAO
MIKDELFQLGKEFQNYLKYWMLYMFRADQSAVYPEISIEDIPNNKADLGSMYLARIIYGSARASQLSDTEDSRPLAEAALEKLKEFSNPQGGYYWGRTYNMQWVHDPENVNMGQAFVLYGLASYAKINPSPDLELLIKEHLRFIQTSLKDADKTQFLDGFDEQWMKGEKMTRSFGTHFHMMEAFVKVYELYREEEVKGAIQDLLTLILDRFIEKEHYSCIHRFSPDWVPLANENWAGHNAECSWVICDAARIINDAILIKETNKLAVLMMAKVVEEARDLVNGGYYNLIPEDGAWEASKSWWPQAEVVLGLVNVYQITGDPSYMELAQEQVSYIQKYFVRNNGEWYAQIDHKGEPARDTPLVFFWKSMYHTVRYYDSMLSRI